MSTAIASGRTNRASHENAKPTRPPDPLPIARGSRPAGRVHEPHHAASGSHEPACRSGWAGAAVAGAPDDSLGPGVDWRHRGGSDAPPRRRDAAFPFDLADHAEHAGSDSLHCGLGPDLDRRGPGREPTVLEWSGAGRRGSGPDSAHSPGHRGGRRRVTVQSDRGPPSAPVLCETGWTPPGPRNACGSSAADGRAVLHRPGVRSTPGPG